ncbi:MAG: hypothetical protein HY880_08165 [Deltaproteobacteria bacterium]|nr:hypothetical protein [Deltaproteobacteria bacterium]
MINRFGADSINHIHIGRSLVYFTDADADQEPRFLDKDKPPLKWDKVKKFFVKNVQQMVLDMERARE